jgi:hypothetical protein
MAGRVYDERARRQYLFNFLEQEDSLFAPRNQARGRRVQD